MYSMGRCIVWVDSSHSKKRSRNREKGGHGPSGALSVGSSDEKNEGPFKEERAHCFRNDPEDD